MYLRFWICLITCFLLSTTAWASQLSGQCQIRFFGDSTLHGFEGQATCEPFDWLIEDESDSGKLIVRGAVIKVPVATMDTANKKRDKKMYQMFSVNDFPLIEGQFDNFDPRQLLQQLRDGNEVDAHFPFKLKIHGVTRSVDATIREFKETPEEITLVADLSVSLKDFGLKAPGVFGIIRVADEVRVEIEVVLFDAVTLLTDTVSDTK